MSKSAFIYCRISQDREGRMLGVQRQQEDCHALAERLGYEVVEVFIENDVSASTRSSKPRPEFKKMIELAPDIDAILSYSSGRLTRRPKESEDLIQLYEQHRTRIHYVNSGDNDLSTARGRSRARDDARRDAEEAEEISERVERDVARRATAGLPHGGTRAFGWTADYQRDEVEHPILVELADRALAGESLKALAKDLTVRGIETVRGAPWSYQAVRRMLANPRIAGYRTRKGEIIGRATWPAAVSETKWRQLEALFSDASRNSGGARGRVNLLTGLARCGECDRPVGVRNSVSKARGARRRYYCAACGLYRTIAPVDTYVTAAVVRMLEEYHENPETMDPEVLRTVEGLRERIRQTQLEFADDDTVTPQDLREMLRHLRGRLEAEEKKLAPSRRHHVVDGVTGDEAAEAWESLTLARKRAIIGALVEVRILRAPAGRKPFDPATVEVNPRL